MTDLQDPPADYDDDQRRTERTPPQNLLAEQSVLGGMMLSKDAITEVSEILTGAEYYRPTHETIHRAILDLYARGEPADPIAVTEHLSPADLIRVGGADYLHRCVNTIPTSANTGYYAEIVKRKALLRSVIDTGTALVGMGFSGGTGDSDDAAGILDAAAARLQKLTAGAGHTIAVREHDLDQVLDDTMADYFSPSGNYLPLPYRDLAEKVPLEPGDFVIVAASPGMGKTTVLADLARCVAIEHGMRAYIGSMEMPYKQLGQRIICAEAGVNITKFRRRTLDPGELRRVEVARERVRGSHLKIDDSSAVPVSRMRTRMRQLQAMGELPDVWIVDYLQIAKAEAAVDSNRTGQVDQLARDMRALAMEFETVVVAAAQLNRQVSQRADKTPVMSDLRESGGIEQNGSVIVMLDRPDYHEPASPRAGEMDLHVVKNRMGPTGVVTVAYQGHMCRARDMANA